MSLLDFKEDYKQRGLDGLLEKLKDEREAWKKTPVRVAVLGRSGVGKSSFINAIRGMTDSRQAGYAPVGEVDQTEEITEYPFSGQDNVVLVDLPCIGTPKFPHSNYLEAIRVDAYDVFVLILSNRFTEIDAFLATEVSRRRKTLYFVRAKVDMDIRAAVHHRKQAEDKTLEDIRTGTEQSIRDLNAPFLPTNVYLINNYNATEYDFGRLTEQINHDIPSWRKDAFVLSLRNITSKGLDERNRILQRRFFQVATVSSLASGLPISGLGLIVDVIIISLATSFCRNMLGIDKDKVKCIGAELAIPMLLPLKSPIRTNRKFLVFLLTGANFAIGSGLKLALYTKPLFGHLLAGLIAYPFCVLYLRNIANACVEEAEGLNRSFMEWVRQLIHQE